MPRERLNGAFAITVQSEIFVHHGKFAVVIIAVKTAMMLFRRWSRWQTPSDGDCGATPGCGAWWGLLVFPTL